MRPTFRIAVLGITAVLGAALPAASQTVAGMRPLFRSDSLSISFAETSPNGKWIIFAAPSSATGQSLWIAAVAGGAPSRLTSEGYEDQTPRWFPAGDRVAFVSTRPNRDGGRKFYIMVLSIDPATGRAAGVPRQVGSEPVLRGGQGGGLVSPDGRWLAYWSVEEPTRLKLVPSNGGVTRIVATLAPNTEVSFGTLVFGPDGNLYYGYQTGPVGAARFTLQRVAVRGGAPETVATADHPIAVFRLDPRFVFHRINMGTNPGAQWELRRLNGEVVAAITLPRGMQFRSGTHAGGALFAVDQSWSTSLRVASTSGGETRVLTTSGRNWPEAWMPDGSAVISDRQDGDSLAVELLPLNGGEGKRLPLPAGAVNGGWSGRAGPYFSYMTSDSPQDAPRVLHAVDVRTGTSRVISASATVISIGWPGGLRQDDSQWVFAERVSSGANTRIEIKSIDPATGVSKVIRSFPGDLKLARDLDFFGIHGERVAYMLQRRDSVDLMLAVGASGNPRRLVSFPMDIESAAWSWGGNRIAVSYYPRGAQSHGILRVIDVPGTADESLKPHSFDLGTDNGCGQLQWMPDDSSILMLCSRSGARIVKLRLSDGERTAVLSGDEPQQVSTYRLSPNGRQIVYPVRVFRGSSIYLVDFKEMLEHKR
jgi:WD40 repeat protein